MMLSFIVGNNKILFGLTFFITGIYQNCFSQNLLTDSLIAVYHLSGNGNDSTTNSNNGTLIGCSATIDRFGIPGGAMNFNGTSDYIDVIPGNNLFKPTSFPVSISAWIRFTGNAGGMIFGNDFMENYYNGIFFAINTATNQLSIDYGDGGTLGSG